MCKNPRIAYRSDMQNLQAVLGIVSTEIIKSMHGFEEVLAHISDSQGKGLIANENG